MRSRISHEVCDFCGCLDLRRVLGRFALVNLNLLTNVNPPDMDDSESSNIICMKNIISGSSTCVASKSTIIGNKQPSLKIEVKLICFYIRGLFFHVVEGLAINIKLHCTTFQVFG